MLDVLNFVRGAVSSSDTVMPVLTHFCIYDGRIQGSNGRVSIDAPLPGIDFEAIIPAERFLRAIDTCGGEPKLRLTDKGRVIVERKPFRATLPSQKVEAYPRAKPSGGDRYPVGDGLLDALKLLRPFIATDAERAWASTVYFDNEGQALAANNAIIAMTKCDAFKNIGEMQLPVFACEELLRLGSHPGGYPDDVSMDDSGVTFYFGDSWLKSAHIAAEWPTETAATWLAMSAKMKKIPPELARSIEQLLPFCPDPKYPTIRFEKGGIRTATGDSEAEIAGFDLGEGTFHAANLLPMLACTDKMAILEKAALFSGKNFKGVMALLRIA